MIGQKGQRGKGKAQVTSGVSLFPFYPKGRVFLFGCGYAGL